MTTARGTIIATINHFEYGLITPILSYGLAVLGSSLGLLCAVRARDAHTRGRRLWWVNMAAWALGGTAIWTMHFTAMLGFSVSGTQIRYSVPVTVVSAVIAVLAVGIGLLIVGSGRVALPKILFGGLFTGLGVSAMHYLGMAAMRLRGRVEYEPSLVIVSVLIGVVAATVALWLAVTVRGSRVIFGSALVMGLAVSGMHYTGMAAMSVHAHASAPAPSGASGSTLLLPIMLIVVFVGFVLFYALLATPTEDDRAASAYLAARAADRAALREGRAPVAGSFGPPPEGRARFAAGGSADDRAGAARRPTTWHPPG